MINKLILLMGLILLSILLIPEITQLLTISKEIKFSLFDNTAQNSTTADPFFASQFASHAHTAEVHSVTAIELDNNNIMAFWYGGTREGHKDVSIFQNTWHNKTKTWDIEKSIISRAFTKKGLTRYIRKLGNPVVTRGHDNSIWLFYVSVSIGGWAGSSINLSRSYDEGKTWSSPKRLITSPFLNLSTLIKGSAVHYTDGTIGLPVYHELLGKFGELLKINKEGDVIDKIRLSWGNTSLQPIIFTLSADNALAMMRYQGEAPNRILTQNSTNAGSSWTPAKKSQLSNPGAGIAGISFFDKQKKLLLAFNNDEQERDDMTLAMSSDEGINWHILHSVENNKQIIADKNMQFAYPWLLQTQNGTIHLLYSWHKSHIKHSIFNRAWLNEKKTIPTLDKK